MKISLMVVFMVKIFIIMKQDALELKRFANMDLKLVLQNGMKKGI